MQLTEVNVCGSIASFCNTCLYALWFVLVAKKQYGCLLHSESSRM